MTRPHRFDLNSAIMERKTVREIRLSFDTRTYRTHIETGDVAGSPISPPANEDIEVETKPPPDQKVQIAVRPSAPLFRCQFR